MRQQLSTTAHPSSPPVRVEPIQVRVDEHAPRAARHHVMHALAAYDLTDEVIGIVELLVSEVVTNFVQHEHAAVIDVDVEVDRAVKITVSGDAELPSMGLVHPHGRPDATSERGRGLSILDTLAAEWGTQRRAGRTAVWFVVGDDADDMGASPHRESSTAADSVVAAAVAIAAATEAELTAAPIVVAGRAAVAAEHAAADAAKRAADAAQRARLARADDALVAAQGVAATAAKTVEAVRQQAYDLAAAVAAAADVAARTVSDSVQPGDAEAAARTALTVDQQVNSAAVAASEETARAAALVADAVAAAAASVAATTSSAAAAIEHDVVDAADAVRAVTTATARQLASDTLERGAAVAQATREASAASNLWQEANQKLLVAGRHDRAIALALQAAMLTKLPESDDLTMAARYRTAAEQDQVGGDWYDALVLPNGSTTLVIGDVIGHDIAAAAVMGQLRNLLRALIWDRVEPPSAVVARLDRAIQDLQINTLATMVVVRIEPPSPLEPEGVGVLRWTNAGHPTPILIHRDGTVVTLDDASDVLLGVRPETVRHDRSHVVPAGATLLLYTDGLVETRDEGIDAGLQRLIYAARSHHQLDPDALLDAVLADMVGDHPDDDVAMLAVRFGSD